MNVQTLEKKRKEINSIDSQILKLISERSELALKVAKEKKQSNEAIYKPEREQEVFKFLSSQNDGPLYDSHIVNIYREIMSAMLALESSLNIAYLGPKGTFSHEAAVKKFGHSLKYIEKPNISAVFQSVENQEVDYGVLPIENSTEGKVSSTLDSLTQYKLNIYAEVHLSIQHQLLGFAKNFDEIKTIYTHNQAWSQCKNWLHTNLPNINFIEMTSTSGGVQKVLENKKTSEAAIASVIASKIYSIPIIEANIQDNSQNYTRFIIVSKYRSQLAQKNRTSILFTLPDKAGSLYQILSHVFNNKINMTSIESRPSSSELWTYVFYVDLEGHQSEENLKKVLINMKNDATMFRVLGSFPIDEYLS